MKIKNLLTTILFITFALTARVIYAEETAEYYPCPIIFVHGVDSDAYTCWGTTVAEFKKYFHNEDGTCKYFDYGGDYLIALDYKSQNNGDISTIARTALKSEVDETIAKLPKGHKKVIVVAHSMGGLVVRSLLKQYPEYQDKIEKVIFVGTPHQGSPLASGVILIDRMIPQLETVLKNNKWSIFNFDLKLPGQFWAYRNRYQQMKKTLNLYKFFVAFNFKIRIKDMLAGDPAKRRGFGGRYASEQLHNQGQGVAVGQLVVPETVTAKKTFAEKIMLGPFTVAETAPLTVTSSYAKTDTFLNNNNFAIPNNFAIIEGTGSITSLGAWCMGKTSGTIFQSLADFEGLPSGNTLADLDEGDGIVTRASQKAISGNENCEAVYKVNSSHITEPNACKTILQSLDDKLVIESVEPVVTTNYSSYLCGYDLKIKLKDYLLADIEIAEISRDGNLIDLGTIYSIRDFYDEETGKYKPYKKYGNSFLKEHEGRCGEKLKAGEFEIYIPVGNRIDIKIRNTVGKTAECTLCFASETHLPEGCFGECTGLFWNLPDACKPARYWSFDWEVEYNDFPHSWEATKSVAYNKFLNEETERMDWGAIRFYPSSPQGRVIGGYIMSVTDVRARIIEHQKYSPERWSWLWEACQTMITKHKLTFNIDMGDKKVKAIKFIGVAFKKTEENTRWHDEFTMPSTREIHINKMEDFRMLIYNDGQLFFDIDTASFKNGDKIEFDIAPEDINLKGENTWEFRSDLAKCNYIKDPAPIIMPSIGSREIDYYKYRTAEIDGPFLLVTFEDEAEEE